MLLDHLRIASHPSGHCDFFQHYFSGKGLLFRLVCGIWEPFAPDGDPQGLRFSHPCCGVSGLAGGDGFAGGGVADSTAGWPNTLGACTAAIPGLSGAAAGAATWPLDFEIAAAWAGFCCGAGTGLGGALGRALGTGILMGLAVDPFAPARLALVLGWAFDCVATWACTCCCCWPWVLIPAQTASLTNFHKSN